MISNIIPCYSKCFNSNKNFYIKVTNHYAYYVYMSLKYTVNYKEVKKQSPVFKPGKSEFLTFPSYASALLFKMFDVSQLPPPVIWVQFSRNPVTICYTLTGQSVQTALCVEVPC